MMINDTVKTSCMNIREHVERINQVITGAKFNDHPDRLYQPIKYILDTGGKRLRPLLTLFGCYLFSGETEKALIPGIGIELFHNFTLMHDDIMDNAPLRRGKETVHKRWNANVAILSGDTMLFKAYQCLIKVEESLTPNVISLFNQCAIEVCEGQQYDMDFENRETVDEQEYLKMITLKTAVVLGFSLQLGALIGGAHIEDTEAIKNFGVHIGIGFQLKDDLLDVFGNEKKFGKKVGGDIIENKKTYLLIKAFERANRAQAKELTYCLQSDIKDDEKVSRVTAIYHQLSIEDVTEQKIQESFETAFAYLEEIDCPDNRKDELIAFSRSLINREN